MKLLLVSPYFPPQPSIASLRVHAFARAWSGAGEAVTVLTTEKRDDQRGLELPASGARVVEVPYHGPRWVEWFRRHRRDDPSPGGHHPPRRGVATPLAPLRDLRGRRGVYSSVRMPDLTDHWVKPAVAWCRAHGPWDVVVSSGGPYTAHLVALQVRREELAPVWVADFRDLWVDNHMFPGLLPFSLIERAAERRCLRAVDLVVTVSDGLACKLAAKTDRRVEVVLNGYDPDTFAELPSARVFPEDGLLRLVYTGTTIAAGQDPTSLIRAVARVKQRTPELARRLRLVVAGQGGEIWSRAAQRLGVSELVDRRGPVPHPEALRMQRDADALVLLDWKSPEDGVLTGKLFEYLAATAPILVVGAGADSPISRMVERCGRGLPGPRSDEDLCRALESLCRAPETLRTGGDREFLASLSRDRQSLRCLDLIRQLRKGAGSPACI